MANGMRQPFPWEAQGPTRVTHEVEEREGVTGAELRAAAELVASAQGDGDDRARRGAEKGAAWVYREMRALGIETTPQAVRDRMNQARGVARRRREGR